MAAYQTIHLLTFNAGLGYLGTNIIGSGSAEARATGLRGILNNQNNFGPTGTVECGGYNLIGVNANYNNLTDALLPLLMLSMSIIWAICCSVPRMHKKLITG